MTEPNKKTDVLIVGAGPSGLMMACQLALHKIPFRIIDKKDHPTSYSGALILHARSLEIFQQLGLSRIAMERGSEIHSIHVVFNGTKPLVLNVREIGKGLTQYPSLLMLEQSITEQLLTDLIKNQGITIERNTELQTFTQNQEEVTCMLKHDTGNTEILKTSYLIAADGAHSLVRKKLQIPFVGKTYQSSLFVTDCNAVIYLPPQTICFSFTDKTVAGFFPLTEGRWRVDSVIPKEFEKTNDLTLEAVARQFNVRTGINASLSDAEWFSVFHSNQRYATMYQKERCFLIGDAAHVCSPIGAQGMNTGIQDAYNLAWKLSFVIKKYANPSLLSSYDSERNPVARTMIHNTDLAFQWLTSNNIILRNARNTLFPILLKISLPLLNHQSKIRKFIFKSISEIGIGYRKSILSEHASGGKFNNYAPKPGDRLPFCLFSENGIEITLQEKITANRLHLIVFCRSSIREESFRNIAEKYNEWLYLHTFSYSEELKKVFTMFGLKNEGWFLIRPDMYIAGRGSTLKEENILRHLAKFYE